MGTEGEAIGIGNGTWQCVARANSVHELGENRARDFLDIGQGSHMSKTFEYETFLFYPSLTRSGVLVRQDLGLLAKNRLLM